MTQDVAKVAEIVAAAGITIREIGGNCPVQAKGTFDDRAFYFRARGDGWQFHVAADDAGIFGPEAWVIERDYGSGFDASWMPQHEAIGFICGGVAAYRAHLQSSAGREG